MIVSLLNLYPDEYSSCFYKVNSVSRKEGTLSILQLLYFQDTSVDTKTVGGMLTPAGHQMSFCDVYYYGLYVLANYLCSL